MPAWFHLHLYQPGAQVSPPPQTAFSWLPGGRDLLLGGCSSQAGEGAWGGGCQEEQVPTGTGWGGRGGHEPPACPRCECVPGYVGSNCSEDFDDCQDHRCQNNARCLDEVNGYSCLCTEGYR